jgi:predicted dehydrogenase
MAAAQATVNAAAPSEKILIGVIGCGGMGMGRMHEAMNNPSVEVVAVCDVDDNHSARAAQDVERKYGRRPKVFRDFRRVLEMKDVDAVIVATPDHWHALPTVLACQAGKEADLAQHCGRAHYGKRRPKVQTRCAGWHPTAQ